VTTTTELHEAPVWQPARPKIRPLRLIVAWLVNSVALFVAAAIIPHVSIDDFLGAVLVSALIGILNAVLPPLIAALRLPLMLAAGFVLILTLDALMLQFASRVLGESISVDNFGWALLTALVAASVTVALQVALGTNDDDEYNLRVTRRIARRTGGSVQTDVPGIVYLEIDGLALPVLKRAMRDGNAPEMARWLQEGTHRLAEWETDLSSQTGASQAGILLG